MNWIDPFYDLGGWIWWILIKFRKTDLEKEQTEEKRPRNLLLVIGIIFIITFIKLNLF